MSMDRSFGQYWGCIFGHLIVVTLETAVLAIYVVGHPLTDKYRVDLTVTAGYWYWVVAVWVPLYLILYFGPRLL
jgi:cytochrome c oxidase subunit 3